MRSRVPGPTAPVLPDTEGDTEPKAECGCWHRDPTLPTVTAPEQEDSPLSVLHTSGAPL